MNLLQWLVAIVVFHTGIILLSTKTFTAVSLYLYKRCFCGKPSKETKLKFFFFFFEHWKSVCYAFLFFFKEMLILCTDSIRKWLLWSVTFLTYFTTRTLAGQKVQSQVFYSQSEKTEGYANINIFQIIYCVKCIWGTENCIKCDAQKFDVILKRGFTFLIWY